ncbi:MAG: DUF3341 domain-containing protein [Chlorobi bacterium]|nr:DUF3341 domain-containing protein [Chlorobiota bacterium]
MIEREKIFQVILTDDEHKLVEIVKKLKEADQPVLDVYSPVPVEEVEHILEVPESRLPKAGFWIGFSMGAAALLLMVWMMGYSYPIVFGGKPYIPWPSLVPPTFETSVLTSAYGMGIIMFIVSKLVPMLKAHPIDPRVTDYLFAILLDEEADEDFLKKLAQDFDAEYKKVNAPEDVVIT